MGHSCGRKAVVAVGVVALWVHNNAATVSQLQQQCRVSHILYKRHLCYLKRL